MLSEAAAAAEEPRNALQRPITADHTLQPVGYYMLTTLAGSYPESRRSAISPLE